MTTDDPILRELSEADPAIGRADADAGEAERVLRYALNGGLPGSPRHTRPPRRPRLTTVLGALSVLVVVGVVVVVLSVGHRGGSSAAPRTARPVTLVYRVSPTPQVPELTKSAFGGELALIRMRLAGAHLRANVVEVGSDEIRIVLSGLHLGQADVARIASLVGTIAQLEFYDWEANVLLPDGRTVARGLRSHSGSAVTISQGTDATPPGMADAGGMTLYAAAKLASTQPSAPTSKTLSRLGPVYFLFGAPGSHACALAASAQGTAPIAGAHCYLGQGPSLSDLRLTLPHGVTPSDGTVLKVPQGIVVLQASNQTTIAVGAPAARFFVLRDRSALNGVELTHPVMSRQDGEPVVQSGFTASGAKAFRSVTATIAHRGQEVSTGPTHLFQHFAVELDGTLVTVPEIDFAKYPDGVVLPAGARGAIVDAASIQQARQLVAELRLGTLPLNLKLLSRHG
jgi:SecD/SecF fusion protein